MPQLCDGTFFYFPTTKSAGVLLSAPFVTSFTCTALTKMDVFFWTMIGPILRHISPSFILLLLEAFVRCLQFVGLHLNNKALWNVYGYATQWMCWGAANAEGTFRHQWCGYVSHGENLSPWLAVAGSGASGVLATASSRLCVRERAERRKRSLSGLRLSSASHALGRGSRAARTVLWSRTLQEHVSPVPRKQNCWHDWTIRERKREWDKLISRITVLKQLTKLYFGKKCSHCLLNCI